MSSRRCLIVTIIFLATSVLVYWQPESYGVDKASPLAERISDCYGWKAGESVPLDRNIVEELRLDDYLNKNFSKVEDHAFLYIGYYLTSKNVGAAHSPLVCFPGQGWQLTDFQKHQIDSPAGPINLMSVVASTSQSRQLLIFWFQAFDATSAGTLQQKLNLIWSRFIHRREDNAFVRVTVPMQDKTAEQALAVGTDLIRAFYSNFLEYIRQGNA